MTFLLSEDEALRKQIQGITVHDQRATGDDVPRQVGVFFGQPDQELRAQVYPYITINMIDILRDAEREMRGRITGTVEQFGYLGPTETSDLGWDIDLPIPVNIDYQITTFSRHPRHDRELLSQLLHHKLPLRFGQLTLDDNTVRRLEVLDVAKRDSVEQAKRLFINAVTVRVTSEIVQEAYREYYKVQEVDILTPEITNNH
ncbi:hypothetical protein UFOVP325_121 [uncultured Caudovirales phage]|uniref:Uncharacterized protein n=1 Tax=uncultured Caudovirales phage TaxID=2100421 RepID=A0A6J5LTT8_9CAUD|nr:hypothetical protein UFOVP325_121 [uncultured Caudovirales phage]CAB4148134.1 hypothetical protein UFOVP430_116 [uncultured Caudovirales phage]